VAVTTIEMQAPTVRLLSTGDVPDPYRLAVAAGNAVEKHIGSLPPVRIIAVDGRDALAVLAAANRHAVLPDQPSRIHERDVKETRRQARGKAAFTEIAPEGALIIINSQARWARERRHLATVLVHELVHTHQLHRPGIRERHHRYLRTMYDRSAMTAREVREHEALIDRHEKEAYASEHLARNLLGSSR
jgi:hypothetical protein